MNLYRGSYVCPLVYLPRYVCGNLYQANDVCQRCDNTSNWRKWVRCNALCNMRTLCVCHLNILNYQNVSAPLRCRYGAGRTTLTAGRTSRTPHPRRRVGAGGVAWGARPIMLTTQNRGCLPRGGDRCAAGQSIDPLIFPEQFPRGMGGDSQPRTCQSTVANLRESFWVGHHITRHTCNAVRKRQVARRFAHTRRRMPGA